MALIKKIKTLVNRDRSESDFSYTSVEKNKQKIIRDLSNAVKENQLRVYYQPIVELNSYKIIGAEALVRWEHPDLGTLYPVDFIPFAEENNTIIEMGKWMIDEVCSHYKEWKDQGLNDIKVTINYSSIQFIQDDIVEDVKKAIRKYELKADFLIFEITERVAIDDYNQMVTIIEKLHTIGVQLALDDFGTGFASLECLSKLKFDFIKLDRCFIEHIAGDETSSAIVKNTINLAKDLKLKVVSEGIETVEQLDMLNNFNCYAGQGYIFSRPVPNEEFKNIASSEKCFPNAHGSMVRFTEKRNYFRVKFPLLLEAAMTITKLNGREIKTGSSPVLIENMSGGGLCFISNLHLPAQTKLVLQFNTKLSGTEIKVFGCPIWVKNIGANLYKYGINFIINEEDRTNLIGILNQFQIRLKNSKDALNDGNFIIETAFSYFNS